MDETDTQRSFFEEVRNVLQQCTFALAQYGYKYESETSNFSQLVPVSRTFILANANGPQVHVYVVPPNGKFSNHCGLSIVHSSDAHFVFTAYLKHHGIEHDTSKFDFRTYPGSARERISAFLENVSTVMVQHMPHILSGEAWEEIPTDWGDYK